MEVRSLQCLALRAVALRTYADVYDYKSQEGRGRDDECAGLPTGLADAVRTLREDVRVFAWEHRTVAHVRAEWLAVDACGRLDRTATLAAFLRNSPPDCAFVIAAANALHQDCASIWPSLGAGTQQRLKHDDETDAVIRGAAWQVAGFRNSAFFYDEACRNAAQNGWSAALRCWLARAPDAEARTLVPCLALIALRYRNYHLLEVLSVDDVEDAFVYSFPDGRIDVHFMRTLADAPPRWAAECGRVARSLVQWAPKLDVARLRWRRLCDSGGRRPAARAEALIDFWLSQQHNS